MGRPGGSERGAGTDSTSLLVVSPTWVPSPHQRGLHPEQLTLEPHRVWVQKAPLATSSPFRPSGISFGVPEGFMNCSK